MLKLLRSRLVEVPLPVVGVPAFMAKLVAELLLLAAMIDQSPSVAELDIRFSPECVVKLYLCELFIK